MIQEINKEDLAVLKSSFLSLEIVRKDLNENPFGHYLAYIENNNILGFLYYSDIYERAEINQLEVCASYRNQKIASKLLEIMITTVQKNITLEVKIDNVIAIHLYQKFKFKQIGIRKGYYNGIDAVLMERKN